MSALVEPVPPTAPSGAAPAAAAPGSRADLLQTLAAAIPLAARIVAACDAYDAMTTDRVYGRAMSAADARAELERCAGSQFDPVVVAALIAELLEPHRHHPLAAAA